MVRILAISDEVDDALDPRRLRRIAPDLVLAAGDLPLDYLEYVASAVEAPVAFVPGNHDPEHERVRTHRLGIAVLGGFLADPRPHGAQNLDDRVVDVAGVRVAGLGGCVRYRPGPNQYSQREFGRRSARLLRTAQRRRPRRPDVDVLLTHAPPRHLGDGEDAAHLGIESLHDLVGRLRPRLLLHGHLHPHGERRPDRTLGGTTVCNVIPHRVLELDRRGT